MDDYFSQFAMVCIEMLCAYMFISCLFHLQDMAIFQTLCIPQSIQANIDVDLNVEEIENISFLVENGILKRNTVFDWKEYVEVKDTNGNDLKDYVYIEGNVNTAIAGMYTLKYTLKWNEQMRVKEAKYYVIE